MRRWIALAWMVMTVSGCENVGWGGVTVSLEPPLSRSELHSAAREDPAAAEEEDPSLPELPTGPLLLAGTRDGSSATLAVVGEIQGGELAELPPESSSPAYQQRLQDRLLAAGTEFVLFSGGVRVGRLVASGSEIDGDFCHPRPRVTGVVELVPGAIEATRFLALPSTGPEASERGRWQSHSHDYDQRVASLSLASEAIPVVSAPWPPSLLESRADIQAFRRTDAEEESIAATFLYQDRLRVEEPGEGAYALFILGEETAGGWRRGYTWYRSAARDGKGAPRYFDHLDWDGDGVDEILLDVFGAEHRWFAALDRRDSGWTRSFQNPCGGGSTTAEQ